jgi:hypothetical protein
MLFVFFVVSFSAVAQTNVNSVVAPRVRLVPNAWSFIRPQSWLGVQALVVAAPVWTQVR